MPVLGSSESGARPVLAETIRAARQRRPLTEGSVFQSKGYYGHRFEESPPSRIRSEHLPWRLWQRYHSRSLSSAEEVSRSLADGHVVFCRYPADPFRRY